MSAPGISRDEWLAAFGEAETPCDPSALTTAELAAMLGLGRAAAATRIKRLVEQGRATRTCKWQPRGNNGAVRVPAYRLVTAPAKPTKGRR